MLDLTDQTRLLEPGETIKARDWVDWSGAYSGAYNSSRTRNSFWTRVAEGSEFIDKTPEELVLSFRRDIGE